MIPGKTFDCLRAFVLYSTAQAAGGRFHRGGTEESMRVWTVVVASVAVAWLGSAVGLSAQAKVGGDPKAAAVKNPVPSNAASITKGRAAYNKSCRHCHGLRGLGDGPLAPKAPKPATLTDADGRRPH